MADYDYTDVNTGEDFTDDQMEDRYQDFLAEVYSEFEVGELTYPAGRVLREIDYIAFREGFNNWIDNEITEGNFREYIDGPVCEDCGSSRTQDDVAESLSIYDRLVCPSCAAEIDEE